MNARLRRDENRAPTNQEIAATRAAAIANHLRLAGHGRRRHGRQVEIPAEVQAQQAADDRQAAIDQAIQLNAKRGGALNHSKLADGLTSDIESLSGLSQDHAKVHYNSAQPAQLNSLA
jgi:hypothetical protein